MNAAANWDILNGTLPPLLPPPEPVLQPLSLGSGQMPAMPAEQQPLVKLQGAPAPPQAQLSKIGAVNTLDLGAPAQPLVKLSDDPLAQQEGHAQNKLQTLEAQDANPWGTPQNHPGFLGKTAHVLSRIGNIAGDIVAPGIMANVPGTELNRLMQEKSLGAEIQGDETAEEEKASREATAQKDIAAAEEAAPNAASTRALQTAEAANDRSQVQSRDQAASQGPSLAVAYSHAVNDVLKRGGDPSQDPIVQHLADAITGIQKQPAPKELSASQDLQNQIADAEKSGDKTKVKQLQQQLKDLNPFGEEHVQISLAGLDDRENSKNAKGDATSRAAAYKAFTPALDSAERFNVMTQNYEEAVKDHNQQAMLSLLYNHMGMTMGLQKGARMTQDLIREAQQSQPWLHGIQAKFDSEGYLTGVTLSPEQMRQMVGLAQSRYSEDVKKARSEAKYMGASDDGPERTPNAATINYYMHKTGGDAQKAKALASQDGWSVQ